mgnify:CR=1 FL=1
MEHDESFERFKKNRQDMADQLVREKCGLRYVGANLRSLEMPQEDAIKVSEWVKSRKNMLVYLGSPGSGKTYLCAALIKHCWPKFESVRFWRELDLMARLGISMNKGMSARAEIPFLIDDEFLIYDDLGSAGEDKDGQDGFKSGVIFDIIDIRSASMKPTVITTNLTIEEIHRRYHPRVPSRLFAQENCFIEIRDVDRRGSPPPPQPDPLAEQSKKPWDKPK